MWPLIDCTSSPFSDSDDGNELSFFKLDDEEEELLFIEEDAEDFSFFFLDDFTEDLFEMLFLEDDEELDDFKDSGDGVAGRLVFLLFDFDFVDLALVGLGGFFVIDSVFVAASGIGLCNLSCYMSVQMSLTPSRTSSRRYVYSSELTVYLVNWSYSII